MSIDENDKLKSLSKVDIDVAFRNFAWSDEEQMLQIIAIRVNELLEQDTDLLMSYLYRLDIDESRINYILNQQHEVPPDTGLAHLILERQKERIRSKEKFKQDKIPGWDPW